MRKGMMRSFLLLLSLHLLLIPSTVAADHHRKYIIYMGSHLPSGLSPKLFYDKLMTHVLGSAYTEKPSEYLLHTYQRSFYGCVAKLTDAEAQKIAGVEGVVSIFPDEKMELQTTRSWDFMGFPIDVPRSNIERDVIVGVFDTGIWPESPSFNDNGLGAVPAKWKGICQPAANFSCNKKIIGARFYKAGNDFPINEGPTPRDFNGHGTHTASTVAGALVPKASFLGLASGTARGGVPSARIAVYKVCWADGNGCMSVDILNAFDDAIADGVDVISMSVGPRSAVPYFSDATAIGAFHAMQRGILASLSAGNAGPSRATAGNVAPWLMSVAASTTDRKFFTDVQLGNGQVFRGGRALNPFDLGGKKFPMIYGGDAPNSSFPSGARFCMSLNRTLVQGKIVVCDQGRASGAPVEAGVAGVVVRFNTSTLGDGSSAYPLPFSRLQLDDAQAILSYIKNASSNPEGTILRTDIVKDKSAPYVAAFSSRGPNPITPTILKITVPTLPFSRLQLDDAQAILSYIKNASSNPEGTILRTDIVKDKSAPYVAAFSSRGPNPITPTILKPDLSAPGVDILAAYSPKGQVSVIPGDTRSVSYHVISGTSMACPHASAAAAYVKSFHPDWSPSAIRSALMTTAYPLDSSINPEAELSYGAGHINPKRAVDPGLVYNATEADYINFLCGQGFTLTQIRQISSDNRTTCQTDLPAGFVGDLNYPSIAVAANSSTFDKMFLRRVSAVTEGPSYYPSEYKVKVTSPKQVSVKVEPETLRFTHPGQELSYTVQVKGGFGSLDEVLSASIEWSDGVHKVRTPVVSFHL